MLKGVKYLYDTFIDMLDTTPHDRLPVSNSIDIR